MAILCVKTEESYIVTKFMSEVRERIKGNNLVKNPFEGTILKIKTVKEDKLMDYYLMIMTPVWPQFFMFGYIIAAIPFALKNWQFTWWMMPGLCLAGLGFFWSKWFIWLMLNVALKKKSYKGPIKVIGNIEAIKILAKRLEN